MDTNYQRQFLYLFERIGENLSFGPRGSGTNLTYFNTSNATRKYFMIHHFSPTYVYIFKVCLSPYTSLMSMACVCRDSEMINPKVWITAFASCLLTRPDTKGFRMPAIWEVMPDLFFSPFCLKESVRQGFVINHRVQYLQYLYTIIEVDSNFTGRDTNVENRLDYFREDLGVNSHHFHWHLIYTLEDPRGRRDRKGETTSSAALSMT
ncbi:Phenoloxidase 3, partial [Folsomia candida]